MDSHFNFSCFNHKAFSGTTNGFANLNNELNTASFGALSHSLENTPVFQSAREGVGMSERSFYFQGYTFTDLGSDDHGKNHTNCRYRRYFTHQEQTQNAKSIREIQVNHEQKVRLIYSEKDKTVIGYVIDKGGHAKAVKQSDIPKSLQHLESTAVFEAFVKGAYAKIRHFGNEDLAFSIHQRGLGGMRLSQQTLENLEKAERTLKNYNNLSPADKLNIINEAVTIITSISLDLPHYEKVTLFLGQSGAGKSTLINYLAGADIKVRWNSKKHDFFLDTPNMLKDIAIGHGFESCTFFPAPHKDEATGLVYFDCPGFLDSRGVIHELINTKLIASVIKSAQAVNFVITVTEASLNDRAYTHLLKNSIDALECYVQNFDSFKDGILLVVTKGADSKRMGKSRDEADDARYLNAKLEDILEEVPLSDYQKRFIEFLQANGNFKYSFKNNLEEGSSVNPAPRAILIDKLQAIKSIESEAAVNIKPNVSAEAHAIVAEFANQIAQDIQALTATYTAEVYAYYSNAIKALGNNFFEDLYPIKAALKTFSELLSDFSGKEPQELLGAYKQIKSLAITLNLDAGNQSLINILSKEIALDLFATINPNLIPISAHVWHKSIEDLKKVFQHLMQELKVIEKKQPVKPGEPYMQERDEAKAQTYLESGQRFEQEQNWLEAEKNYKKALKFTDQPEAYELYVNLLSRTADDMKLGKAFYELGQLHQKDNKQEKAKQAYQNANSKIIRELSEPILKQLVAVCKELQQYGSAGKHARAIALLHAENRNSTEASSWYEKASELYKQKGKLLRAQNVAEIKVREQRLQEISSEAEKARIAHEASISQVEQQLKSALIKAEDERNNHHTVVNRLIAEKGNLLQATAAQLEQKEKYQQEALEALKQAHEAKLGQSLAQLTEEKEAQLRNLKIEKDNQLTQLQEAHQAALSRLSLEKDNQINQLNSDKQFLKATNVVSLTILREENLAKIEIAKRDATQIYSRVCSWEKAPDLQFHAKRFQIYAVTSSILPLVNIIKNICAKVPSQPIDSTLHSFAIEAATAVTQIEKIELLAHAIVKN